MDDTEPCSHCPAGDVFFIDPPNGIVDARRPHPPNNPQSSERIRIIKVAGPPGATEDCWQICRSDDGVGPHDSVIENPPGTYTIDLGQPITPGSAIRIRYKAGDLVLGEGVFTAHPGNVDANAQTNAADLLALVDHLNGVRIPPLTRYSGDLDHSGVIAPADILTLIDLLNGANGFAVWYGTPLPQAPQCP